MPSLLKACFLRGPVTITDNNNSHREPEVPLLAKYFWDSGQTTILFLRMCGLLASVPQLANTTLPALTFRLILYLFVDFWQTRESFGMARGLRFWALGVDSGPRGSF